MSAIGLCGHRLCATSILPVLFVSPPEAGATEYPPGFELKGCAYWRPLCGFVMGSGPDTYVLSAAVPWNTPITVFGRKTGNTNLCGTQVEVTGYAPNPKISCQFR
jgi:hypothetical protein